ncbi:MAG: peptidylprolyl isomerase [Planctomycetaceae bacterium]
MQDATQLLNTETNGSRLIAPKAGRRSTMLVGGTLIALVAAGIGMQVWRAQNSKAAEQKDSVAGSVRLDDTLATPVGRVNGQPVTYEMLAKECIERHGKDVLENVINRTIIQQACAEAGVTVTEAEVNQEIVKISKKFGLPVGQWYKMLEAERGLTALQYHRDVIWPMLALKKLAGKEVKITNEMMKEAYTDNYGPRVKARMIVMDNQRRATEIWEKLQKDPELFEDFARDYSVEPTSRILGGSIPPIRRYSGAHENIRKAAFNMQEPGEISNSIIQIGINQYVILKYEGRTEPIDHDRDAVAAQLHEELVEREVQKMVAETFSHLRENARIDNYLTNESTVPAEESAATVNPSKAVSFTTLTEPTAP